jgi:hypothetical protein
MATGPGHHRREEMQVEPAELVACTLAGGDLSTQRGRWRALGQNVGLGHRQTDDGIELRFRYHPAVEEELRTLVAVENDCCNWAAWDVERRTDVLVMTARSHGEGITTLHAMVTQLV